MKHVLVYMTFPDQDAARRVGRSLLENRLVACVNILPGVQSVYWWEDKIQDENEVVLLAKTRDDLFEDVRARVCAQHPYEVPCVVALEIGHGHTPFLHWIDQQTGGWGDIAVQNELTDQENRS